MEEDAVLRSGIWSWKLARDSSRVHRLLVANDRALAKESCTVPDRNMSTTEWAVGNRLVHVLSFNGADVAMITLSWTSPFDITDIGYPPRTKPLYMQRFAVEPRFRSIEPLTGVRVLRYAIAFAEAHGADALRSETNPSYKRICQMLYLHDFEPFLRTVDPDGREHIFLERNVKPVLQTGSNRTEDANS